MDRSGKVIDIAVDESWGTGVYVLATAYRPNGKAERLGASDRAVEPRLRRSGIDVPRLHTRL